MAAVPWRLVARQSRSSAIFFSKATHFSHSSVAARCDLSLSSWSQFFSLAGVRLTKLPFLASTRRRCCLSTGIKNYCAGCFIGTSSAAAMMAVCSLDSASAMTDQPEETLEPSQYFADDINTFWALARKYQLPIVLFVMLCLGWRQPLTLAVNLVVLFFCTRPNPSSIYLFVEQVRQSEMRKMRGLPISNFRNAKIDVEDYKLLCLGKIELRSLKLHVVGILGGWWVFSVTPI